jgi:hypothetical protein
MLSRINAALSLKSAIDTAFVVSGEYAAAHSRDTHRFVQPGDE